MALLTAAQAYAGAMAATPGKIQDQLNDIATKIGLRVNEGEFTLVYDEAIYPENIDVLTYQPNHYKVTVNTARPGAIISWSNQGGGSMD